MGVLDHMISNEKSLGDQAFCILRLKKRLVS